MRKRIAIIIIFIIVFCFFLLTSCNSYISNGQIEKVGMLVESTIHDQAWGSKGYVGLLEIKEEFNVDVYFKEGIQTDQQVYQAIEEFANKGVNLVFGHSSHYGKIFKDIRDVYPDIHFVYFNGGYSDYNLTSLNFSSNAMGFFGGMVAGEMTKTNQVAILAAYEWQPEVEGFYEGVNFQNPDANVQMEFVNGWDNVDYAFELYERLKDKGVDIFYPAGDGYSVPIIERLKEDGLYGIGFVSDQLGLGEHTVLTSTVQHVDHLYLLAAKQFNEGELSGGIRTYDFHDGVITLGEFSPDVPKDFVNQINEAVEEYGETKLLPNEY